MKYMTFNSSCSYAGIANLLSFYGVDTEDRTIALEMGLPFLFDYEDGCYVSGPMLQSAKWFNIYLETLGYTMTEREVNRYKLCDYLRDLQYAMLGIYVRGENKHAVIYTGLKDGKFCLLNNKWKESDEPDTLLLSEQELLQRVNEKVTVANLNKTACDIRASMNTLFRAILLDSITMLELIGETQISRKLKIVQGQFMDAVKQNRPLQLDQCLDIALLKSAIEEYINLICARA